MKKWLPLILIGIAFVAFFLLGLNKYFSLAVLKEFEPQLFELIARHPILSPILFTAFYAVTVILILPVGLFLSIAAGFFFHHPIGELSALFGSTIGACILFLLARGPLHTLYLQNAGSKLKKIDREFERNSINYLLFLRLLPLSPFGLVNLACAFFGVRFWSFAWTTFVGNIIPTSIFVAIGSELGTPAVHWHRILLLMALALLSLLPIFFKKRRN